MVEDEVEYAELAVAPMKLLISFIFQARQESGASKHTVNRASCLAFLETVSVYQLGQLIENPPAERLAGATTTATLALELVLDTSPVVAAEPLLALADPRQLTLSIELPPALSLKTEPPSWVEACLTDQSATAAQLVGYSIVYKWPARLGGWLVGKVTEINTDRSIIINEHVANFVVFYEDDQASAQHHLSLARYAKSSNSKTDSWALLA